MKTLYDNASRDGGPCAHQLRSHRSKASKCFHLEYRLFATSST
jgi:hypothetical protein